MNLAVVVGAVIKAARAHVTAGTATEAERTLVAHYDAAVRDFSEALERALMEGPGPSAATNAAVVEVPLLDHTSEGYLVVGPTDKEAK